MNTALYIGPYRQYDYHGVLSNIHLSRLSASLARKDIKLYSRPLFLDSSLIQNTISSEYSNYELLPNEPLNIHCVIQHCPVEYVAIQKKWINICIPILDPKIVKSSSYGVIQKLNLVDHIIVHNDHQKNFLLKSGISVPISLYEENIVDYVDSSILQKMYDFGAVNNGLYRFGFIGTYSRNLRIIQKIIISFINAYRQHDTAQLIFFLRGTQQEKNELEKFYLDTLKNLNVNIFDHILFIFNPLDSASTITALNSMDCLLSINDDYVHHLYEAYLLKNGKSVISRNSLNTISVPPISLEYDIEDTIGSICTQSLIEKMISIPSSGAKNKKSNKSNPNIGDLACRILQ